MNRNKNFEYLEDFIKKNNKFDVIIIGGGITGAGVALGCIENGLKTLLLEAKDFGYSTSGNSSKLVHGGLRYLQNGQVLTTYNSVKEREKLLKELPFLIWPIQFLLPYFNLKQEFLFSLGLSIYDYFAGKSSHKKITKNEILKAIPNLRIQFNKKNKIQTLKGGILYTDAQTDDIRLLIRTLKEAESKGAMILNYFPVKDLVIQDNIVKGVIGYDLINKKEFEIYAKLVINATGFYVDHFREKLGLKKIIRPLRGSHIAFSSEKISIPYAIGFQHPIDKRNVFVLPWFGLTVVGTTDIDHDVDQESKISVSSITKEEIQYLLSAINYIFPNLNFTEKDIYSTWSGVRPVVSFNFKRDPSKESRDIYIELYKNLLTITGGKLTTFRLEAKKTLEKLKKILPIKNLNIQFDSLTIEELANKFQITQNELNQIQDIERLLGFYGKDVEIIIQNILKNPEVVSNFQFYRPNHCLYKEEIHYSIREEWVVYWEDLIYRRFRIGIAKKDLIPKIKEIYNQYYWGKNE